MSQENLTRTRYRIIWLFAALSKVHEGLNKCQYRVLVRDRDMTAKQYLYMDS